MRKYSAILTLSLLLLGIIASLLWYRWDVTQQKELNYLSLRAREGDLKSVRRLSDINSSDAIRELQNLAKDESAVGYCRVAAIEFLGAKGFDDRGILTSLISIGEPFSIRHAAAVALAQSRCEESCVCAALLALHSLESGQPTLEMTIPMPERATAAMREQTIDKLRSASTEDYIGLLKRNPCLAWKLIKRDYADNSTLIAKIKPQVDPC